MSDEMPDYGELSPEQEAARATRFDRWLAAHDAKVRAAALKEAEEAVVAWMVRFPNASWRDVRYAIPRSHGDTTPKLG